MYETRTLNLAVVSGRPADGVTSPRYVANWGYRLAHLVLACAFFVLLVPSFPLPQGQSVGLIPVSFRTTQELAFPVLWREWVRPAAELLSRGDSSSQQTAETRKSQDPEPVQDPKSRHQVAARNTPAQMDAREGMGGAGIGTDLVMRVQSPVKLYWLAQLYDVYDGKTWRASPMLREGQGGLDRRRGVGTRTVEQHISIEKTVTSRLPGAYRVTRCVWDGDERAFNAVTPGSGVSTLARIDTAGAFLRAPPDDLPWQYRCTSEVPTLDTDAHRASWESLEHQGWNYRRLPDRLVSERLRRLAGTLTQDCDTPMSKALTIQERLRRHYTYTVTPAPIPEKAEPVDYFLFESREGYCQHFAQAFTVLARLAGLPARLATGYSPGNHNLLANCFEVYEYHAHAWTQIFVEPYGWLTFDGVAPGNLRLESGPSFLRRLMDPFGDDWSARPPELALRAPPPPPPPTLEPPKPEATNPISRVSEGIYARAMLDSKSLEPDAGAVVRAAGVTLKEWFQKQVEHSKTALVAWGTDVWARLVAMARRLLAFLRSLTAGVYVVAAVVGVAACVLWRRRRLMVSVMATAWRRWRCRRHWRRLQRLRDQEPALVMAACAEMLGEVMRLGRFVRPTNLDMLEYARWLQTTEPRLAADYQRFADTQCRVIFRDILPTRDDAECALVAVDRIRIEVLQRLTLSGGRRRSLCADRPAAA